MLYNKVNILIKTDNVKSFLIGWCQKWAGAVVVVFIW